MRGFLLGAFALIVTQVFVSALQSSGSNGAKNVTGLFGSLPTLAERALSPDVPFFKLGATSAGGTAKASGAIPTTTAPRVVQT